MPRGKKNVEDAAYDPSADNIDQVEITPVDNPIVSNEPVGNRKALDHVPSEPSIHDPAWTPYVLSMLMDDEVFDGCPTVPALRRVAALLLGEITEIDSQPFQLPSVANDLFATVKTTISILWSKDMGDRDAPTLRTFTGLADCYLGNASNKDFARYPTATAETRSEGRALKRALHLVKVLTSEERSGISVEESGVDGKISWAQRNFIDMKCRQANINVALYLKCGKVKYESIMDVPSATADSMTRLLSDWQQNPAKIPEAIRGYDPDWNKSE